MPTTAASESIIRQTEAARDSQRFLQRLFAAHLRRGTIPPGIARTAFLDQCRALKLDALIPADVA